MYLGGARGVMAGLRAAAEFDEISEVYDATREPLEASVVDTVASTLREWGLTNLLEVGVGTGRVALPLLQRGLAITGIDASGRMLARARAKGVPRLVRGSAYDLPFAERAFDATLFVHVLHVLEDPARALREACRVARGGAVGLVRPRSSRERGGGRPHHPRALVVEQLRREGIVVSDRARGGPPERERQLIERFPPQRTVVVSESDVTEPLAKALEMFERRASRWTLHVPPEALARAVAAARAEVGNATYSYHRVLSLALWDRAPPEREATPSEPGVDAPLSNLSDGVGPAGS